MQGEVAVVVAEVEAGHVENGLPRSVHKWNQLSIDGGPCWVCADPLTSECLYAEVADEAALAACGARPSPPRGPSSWHGRRNFGYTFAVRRVFTSLGTVAL